MPIRNWGTQRYITPTQRAGGGQAQFLAGTMAQRGVGVNAAGGLGLYGGYGTPMAQQATAQQNPDVTKPYQAPPAPPAPTPASVPGPATPGSIPPPAVGLRRGIASTMAQNNTPVYAPAPYRTDPNDPNRGSYGQGGATVMPTITVAKPWAPQGFNTDNAADWARLQQPGSTTTNAQGQIVWAPQATTPAVTAPGHLAPAPVTQPVAGTVTTPTGQLNRVRY